MRQNIVQTIFQELSVARYSVRKRIANEAALKASFALQVFGMMLNNTSLLLVWVWFFQAFGEVNRWSVAETVAFQGFAALVYGLAFGFGDGVRALPQRVHFGTFDNLLLTPRNLYVRIVTDRVKTSAFGDMVYGVILLGIYFVIADLSIVQILLAVGTIIPAVLIMVNVTLIASLLAFIFPDAQALADDVFEIFLSPSLYPAALYEGVLRFIFLFGIPSLAIGGLPVEIVRDVSMGWFAVVWGLAIFWTILANALLSRAVRRYESGNLVAARS